MLGGSSVAEPNLIVLIGFMGAGKSSVGVAMSQQLGWDFEDLDQRIERRTGRKVAEVFRESGEAGFRRAEHAALKEILSELPSNGRILALGGGAFAQKRNARLIEERAIPTVFLDASVDELWRRCSQQSTQETVRPLVSSPERFRELYRKRLSHYLKSTLRHETDGKSVARVATELIQALALKTRGGKKQ